VYGFIDGPADRALLAHLAQALRNIGYKASTRTVRYNDAGYTFVSDPRHGVQMWGKDGWIADYPSADTFYDTLNSCRVKNQGSGFCDKYIDHLAAVARTTALTDPSKARRLWKTIDKLVTDAAPWVTLGIGRSFEFTSSRVGNFQSPPYIPLYDQLWVK
jgi:ABC-type transport system substrate-binding protein